MKKTTNLKTLLFLVLFCSSIFLTILEPLLASTGDKDYLIEPTDFTDDAAKWNTEAQAYDWNNATSCTTTAAATDGSDLDLHTWNTTDNQAEEITYVDIYIRADWSFTANDYITVKWYVSATQGVGTFVMDSGNSGDDQIISFENVAEPNDADWSWTDVGNILVEFDMERTSGNDLVYVRIDETWGWIDVAEAQPDEEDPTITIPDHDPDDPDENDNLRFDATITDNVDVTYAYTIWRIDEAGWTNSSMTEGASDEWFYLSGTHSVGDDIDYWFTARDLAYNWAILDNSGTYYNVIITDQTAPDITNPDHDPDSPTETSNLQFDADITDNVDVTNAFALWRVDGGSFTNSSMTEGGSNNWYYQSGTHAIGELIEYWFKARDAVSNWQTLDNTGSYYSITITDQDDPVISVPDHDPDNPKETDSITFSATCTDNDDVTNAYVLVRVNEGSWDNYTMTEGGSNIWSYNAGTYSIDDDIDYWFTCRDPSYNWVILDNSGSYYNVIVTDQTLPVISNPEHSPSTPKETDSLILRTTCTDNDDVSNAYVLWRVDGGSFTNSTLTEGGSNVWSFDTGTHAIGELIEYWFKARDPTGLWQTLDNTGSYYPVTITDQDTPTISGEFYDPDPALYTDNIQINATVTDNDNVKNASVWWRVDAGSWSEALMSKDGDIYYYTIGSFSTGEYIEYFIEAYDDSENGVNGSTHGFYIVEQDPPVITNVQQDPASPITEIQTVQINATVTDAYLDKVLLVWRINLGSWQNASMSNIEGDIWTHTIGTFSISDDIDYYIYANDTYENFDVSTTYGFNCTDQDLPVIASPDHNPDEPKETDSVVLSATCTDNDDVTYAYVLIRINLGSWNNYSMSEGGSNVWSYDSGTYSIGDDVDYYFTCRDTSYNWQTSSVYGFNVTDQTIPDITNPGHFPVNPTDTDNVKLNATITDNNDVTNAYVLIRINLVSWNNYSMTEGSSNEWYYNSGTYSIDDDVDYYFQAKDPSNNWNQTIHYGFNVTDQSASPEINHPANMTIIEGSTGNIIIWIASDDDPYNYTVYCNNESFETANWTSGNPININVDGLSAPYTWNISILVQDEASNKVSDTVFVTVITSETAPIPIPNTDPPNPDEELPIVFIIIGIVIIILFLLSAIVLITKKPK